MTGFATTWSDTCGLRRSLGHELADQARLLRRFVAHLDATTPSS